ncbi:MAG: phage/plasmid replication protein [Peptostreptococcaceae bacterium]
MVHTAQFYLVIDKSEIDIIRRKVGNINKNEIGLSISDFYHKCNNKLFFTVDFIKLLGKPNITENDIEEIEDKLKDTFRYYLSKTKLEFIMIRLEYRLDIKLDKDIREILLYLYSKCKDKSHCKEKKSDYETTVYFNSKSITSKIYDKAFERSCKGEEIEEFEEDVLRFEVTLKNKHLNYKKRNYKNKRIEEYLQEDLFKYYLKRHLEVHLFCGDYYTIDEAIKILIKYKVKNISDINEFLIYTSRFGITKAYNKYGNYKYNLYKKILDKNNINLITIPKSKNYKTIKNPLNL